MRGSTAGLADTLSGAALPYDRLLSFLDATFAAVVVAPLVVAYWRGTWNLAFVYIFPDDILMSSMASVAIGFSVHFSFTMGQYCFRNVFHPEKKRLTYYIFTRLYTYIFGFGCVNAWKGGWSLLDIHVGLEPKAVWTTTLAAFLALSAMRCLRNVAAPPFAVVIDSPQDYFDVPTMFRTNTKEMALYILDCVFSVSVVGSLVLFVWRGTWALLDIYIYPTDPIWSSFGSLVLGYLMVIVSFSAQNPMRWLCSRLHGAWRVAVADVFLAFSFVATVNVWRGIWQIMDIYFLSDNRMASDWISHSVSLLLLVTMNCSNSVLVRGVYIDAEEQAGECVLFPCHYLRLIVHQQRGDKRRRRLTLAAVERLHSNASVPLVDGTDMKATPEKVADQIPAVHWQTNERDDSKPLVLEKKS